MPRHQLLIDWVNGSKSGTIPNPNTGSRVDYVSASQLDVVFRTTLEGTGQWSFTARNGNLSSNTRAFNVTAAAAKAPTFVDDLPPANVVAGNNYTFKAVWRKVAGDYIVDARFRYRRSGTSSWSNSSMSHDGSVGADQERFAVSVSFASEGTYEYQYRASGSNTASSTGVASNWTSIQTINVESDAAAPVISSLSPTSLTASDSLQTILVNGSGFTSDTKIDWVNISKSGTIPNPNTGSRVDYVSASRLEVVFRTTLEGTGQWSFRARNGNLTSNAEIFNVDEPATTTAPKITRFDPTTLVARDGDQSVVIYGEGFTENTSVHWQNGNKQGTSRTQYRSPTRLDLTINTTLGGHGTWYFTPSNGDEIGPVKTFVVTQEDEPAGVTLSVVTQGNGRVSSQPHGIECGTICSQEFETGSEVTLYASPDTDWQFETWGSASQCGANLTCKVTLNQNATVSANFVAVNDNSTTAKVTNFYPKSLPKGERNTITFEGSNLAGPLVLNIEGTASYCEQLLSSESKVEFSCKPGEQGEKRLYLKDEPGGETIEGSRYMSLSVTEPANMAPRVWVADGYKRQTIVGDQYFITAQSYDAEANLRSIQVDWQANGNWNSVKEASNGNGQAILFSYFPQSTGTLKIRFRATDDNGAVGVSKTYNVNVAPKPQTTAPVNTGGSDTAVSNTRQTLTEQCEANPITPANGAKIETRSLLAVNGLRPITFDLHYNSLVRRNSSVGIGWDFANAQVAKVVEDEDNNEVFVKWSQNKEHIYKANTDGSYAPESHACRLDTLTKQENGQFTVERSNRDVHFFDEFNFLKRIENEKGQGLDFMYNDNSQLEKVIEPQSGNYIKYTYDAEGYLTQAQTRAGLSVSLKYSDGRLSEIRHADGVIETFGYTDVDQLETRSLNGVLLSRTSYDEFGRAVEQDDTKLSNQLFKFDYEEADSIITTKVQDRNGQEKLMLFDEDYKLLSETDALGNIKSYEYNEDGRPTSMTDGNSNVTLMTYNTFGDVTSMKTPDGSTETRTYDERRNLLKVVDALGQEKSYIYDAQNNLISFTDELGNTTVYTYNADNQLLSETTPEGRLTAYTYVNGLLSSVTNPAGNTRSITYDMDGRVISESDFENNFTTYELDGLGRKLSETDPLGNRQSWTYDARGNMLTHTDARGILTQYEYNAQADLIRKTITDNNLQSIWHYEYDGESRLLGSTDPLGNKTTFERDALGRMIKSTDALGNVTTYEYDANGNAVKEIDPLNNASTSQYDEMDRMVEDSDPLGNSTKSIFDALGRLTSTEDALSRFWENAYDAVSRLVSLTHPSVLPATQQFDADGNITRVITPGNHGRWLTLDSNARVTRELTHDQIEIDYDYNGNDLVSSMTNGRDQVSSYSYDMASRMTQMDDVVGSISYEYDAVANRTEVTEGNLTIGRSYDAFNRVVEYKEDTSSPKRTRYTFDLSGNITSIAYPSTSESGSGYPLDYTYDELNRVKTISGFIGGAISASYEYDEKGRITSLTRGNGTVLTLRYDSADRLLQSTDKTSSGQLIADQTYSYDEIGRLTQEVRSPETSIPLGLINEISMQYGASNRLTSFDGVPVNYDGDGNALTTEGLELEFNARNQLTKAGDYSYSYNAEGHRIARVLTEEDGSTKQTQYVISPDNLGLIQTLREVTPFGAVNDFVYGPQGLIGQFNRYSAKFHYFHYDYRGSVIAVTDSEGTVVARYGYLPYGQQFTVEGSFETPFGYNGRDGVISDPNNLIYMRARYYSPTLQRFLTKDPLRGELYDLASLNRYGYVGGDPVNGVDPSGNFVILAAPATPYVTAAGGVALAAARAVLVGGTAGGVVGGGTAYVTSGGDLDETKNGASGGFVTGGCLALTRSGGCVVAGETVTSVGNQYDATGGYTVGQTVVDVGLGVTTDRVGGKLVDRIPGVTSGQGNFGAVFQAQTTNLRNGNTQNLSYGTFGKGVTAGAVEAYPGAQLRSYLENLNGNDYGMCRVPSY